MTDNSGNPNRIGRNKDGTFAKGSVPNPKGRPVGHHSFCRDADLIVTRILKSG